MNLVYGGDASKLLGFDQLDSEDQHMVKKALETGFGESPACLFSSREDDLLTSDITQSTWRTARLSLPLLPLLPWPLAVRRKSASMRSTKLATAEEDSPTSRTLMRSWRELPESPTMAM